MKFELYAWDEDAYLMRIENIADTFDSDGELIYQHVNLKQLALQLFEIANDGNQVDVQPIIIETTLTAN